MRQVAAGFLLLTAGAALAAPPVADDCGLEPPGSPAWVAVPHRPFESRQRDLPPLVRRAPALPVMTQLPWGRTGAGFLAGKTVYLSPGHGFTFTIYGWRTQRGLTNGLVEDLASAEAVQQYLSRYLRQAGARVVTVREGDLTEALVVVDESDWGAYREEGAAGRFAASAQAGWGRYTPPLTASTNPFALGQNRLLTSAVRADARAVYTPTLPQAGEYNVYVSYSQHESRAADAHYVVHHPGGEAHFRVDQRRHGGTWILLGRFYFQSGASAAQAVTIENDSATPGATVSLDAVRFGGGMGDIDRGKGTSGRPRWEEAARYYAQYNGAPAAVFDQPDLEDHNDDVGTRSRFAAWDHEDGEDAVYLAWHTNAPNPGVGTSSYVYGPNPPDGTYNFTGVPGSDILMRLVHDEIVADLRKGWDPTWRDRGKYSAYFGEVNPRHNPETPAALIEVAFHDTPSDALQLRQAGFRRLVARAMYQGLARFFAQKDGKKVALLPEPPVAACATGTAPGEVLVRWRAPEAGPAGLGGDPATAYRVYRSADGNSWDEGTDVTGTSVSIAGLTPGAPVYLRISAVNGGGESFSTSLLAVRTRRDGQPARVLLVGGFDRLDGGMLVPQDLSSFDLGLVQRMLLDRMNDGSYLAAHARALTASDISFDACERAAVAGDIALPAYALVDWQAGETSQTPIAFTAAERAALTAYRGQGGRLLLSGSEVFWALGNKGGADERDFINSLGVTFLDDDAKVHVARPMPGRAFDGLADLAFDDGRHGVYNVHTPDVIGALPPAQVELVYQDGSGAAVVNDPRRPAVLSVGFPLEAIYDEGLRAQVFARALRLLGVPPDPQPMLPPAPADMTTEMPADMPVGCACRAAGHADVAAGPSGLGVLALAALASLVHTRRWRRRQRPRAAAPVHR